MTPITVKEPCDSGLGGAELRTEPPRLSWLQFPPLGKQGPRNRSVGLPARFPKGDGTPGSCLSPAALEAKMPILRPANFGPTSSCHQPGGCRMYQAGGVRQNPVPPQEKARALFGLQFSVDDALWGGGWGREGGSPRGRLPPAVRTAPPP